MNKMTKETLRLLVYAQCASDGGKHVYGLVCSLYNTRLEKGAEAQNDLGYQDKVSLIARALELCSHNTEDIVRYYVKETPDQNGYASVLVYFDIKLEGERLQCSFHNPVSNATRRLLAPYVGKGRVTRWRKKPDSRDSVYIAAKEAGLL